MQPILPPGTAVRYVGINGFAHAESCHTDLRQTAIYGPRYAAYQGWLARIVRHACDELPADRHQCQPGAWHGYRINALQAGGPYNVWVWACEIEPAD